jgi:hypothetical protein
MRDFLIEFVESVSIDDAEFDAFMEVLTTAPRVTWLHELYMEWQEYELRMKQRNAAFARNGAEYLSRFIQACQPMMDNPR